MEITIKVKGMTCNHCKMTVEGALKGLEGVQNAVVSIETGDVKVTYDQDKVSFIQMQKAIENQGYDVEN